MKKILLPLTMFAILAIPAAAGAATICQTFHGKAVCRPIHGAPSKRPNGPVFSDHASAKLPERAPSVGDAPAVDKTYTGPVDVKQKKKKRPKVGDCCRDAGPGASAF